MKVFVSATLSVRLKVIVELLMNMNYLTLFRASIANNRFLEVAPKAVVAKMGEKRS